MALPNNPLKLTNQLNKKQYGNTYNFMGTPKVNLRPLDRTVGSTPVNGAYVGLDIETFEGTNYLYLEDIEKGHPLYVGGGVLKGCEAMRTNPYSMENE